MSTKRSYGGNARFIEIGSPGVPFRFCVNVDHIDGIRFEQSREELPDGQIIPTDGWSVLLVVNGQNNSIGFGTDMTSAINCYNSILQMISANGVPIIKAKPIPYPKPPEVDKDAISDAVEAADLHPELAGGEGDGTAPNDDEYEISDEEYDLLEEQKADAEIEVPTDTDEPDPETI